MDTLECPGSREQIPTDWPAQEHRLRIQHAYRICFRGPD